MNVLRARSRVWCVLWLVGAVVAGSCGGGGGEPRVASLDPAASTGESDSSTLVASDVLVYEDDSGSGVSSRATAATGSLASTAAAATSATAAGPTLPPVSARVVASSCDAVEAVKTWPIARQAAQLVMPGVPSASLGRAAEIVAELGLGGILVLDGNNANLAAGIAAVKAATDPAPFVAVDEEGGRVQRLKALTGRLPSARDMAGANSAEQVRAIAVEHGKKMAALGFTMDMAPVLDLNSGSASGPIGDRAFSADPAIAAQYGRAFADGLWESGVVPVLKHFPGIGSLGADTHVELPVGPDVATLRSRDLEAFRLATQSYPGAVMVAHVVIPDLTGELPASTSYRAITELLRGEFGFSGLIISDSLSMGAITTRWEIPQAAEHALAAGSDVALIASAGADLQTARATVNRIVDAVVAGRIPADALATSVARVLITKGLDPCVAVAP